MRKVESLFAAAKLTYDAGGQPLAELLQVSLQCLSTLEARATPGFQGECAGKTYWVFSTRSSSSRPYLPALFTSDPARFKKNWTRMLASADGAQRRFNCDPGLVNRALYTSVTAFSACYDLWKPGSRKTPGTFFEVILGTVLKCVLPNHLRTKHIQIPGEEESVSTDIVFRRHDGSKALVIPAKITTRERVVQPFAHQRILDSVFGERKYSSVLMCVSELQRDSDVGVNEICVPGTIRLFQRHLAQLRGLYYLDPPARYCATDITSLLKVGTIGDFVTSELPNLS